jgi:Fe2+ transport system protein FeoA
VPLSTLQRGQSGVITEARLDPDDAALLRAMGLCMSATVKVVRPGQPCVVAVGGVGGDEACACGGTCRIGLARGLAEQIFVTTVA